MSERRNNLQVLHVVHHDTFSNTIDYAAFLDHVEKKILAFSKEKEGCAVLYIEFYGFSHFYGSGINMYERDSLLIEKIGRKLISMLDEMDVVARVGDYQYIVMHHETPGSSSYALAKCIIDTFSEPCMINGQMFYIYTSIGISLYPFEDDDIYRLVKISEAKKDRAKQNGRNFIGTVQETTAFLNNRQTELKKALPAAVENGEITFVYQLQYSHKYNRFSGAEILARWYHPTYGEIPPDVFIPLAEQSGMIASLTIRAIVEASRAFDLLKKESIDEFSLSVNISPLFLLTNHFYQTLEFLVKEYALDRHDLHFELTEEIFLKHTDYLMNILHKVKALGIKIELDDFGAGYTSVKQLAELPLDIVKVDRSFIHAIHVEMQKRDMLKAIVEMTKVLDIAVIAEGVETDEEDSAIKALAPLTVQGFFHARPQKLDGMISHIKRDIGKKSSKL